MQSAPENRASSSSKAPLPATQTNSSPELTSLNATFLLELRKRIRDEQFATWFRGLRIVDFDDANVDLAGSLSIAADRTYEFVGRVAPKDDTPAEMREQMRFLGTPNERGQFELRLEGRL